MARDLVNLGTGPDSQDADRIRPAFARVNNSLRELYDRSRVWEEGIAYVVNDIVRHPTIRKLYRCVQTHAGDATFTVSRWTEYKIPIVVVTDNLADLITVEIGCHAYYANPANMFDPSTVSYTHLTLPTICSV